MADSIVFYKSFYDAIRGFDADLQAEVYNAIMMYSFYGEEPEDLSLTANGLFTLIKPQIDANMRRKENGKKGAASGYLGGRPKKENPIGVIDENPIGVKPKTPNVNVNVNDNVNKNVEGGMGEKRKRFIPPTLDDVKAYCRERNNLVDPQKFFDYYEQGGWKDSKGNPVKNWKQKLITWENKETKTEKTKSNNTFHFGNERKDIDFEALKKRVVCN